MFKEQRFSKDLPSFSQDSKYLGLMFRLIIKGRGKKKKEIGSVYLRKEGRFVSIPLMSFRLSFRMTHSWKEEPEQQNLDSLDGWAKSNNLNCMRINANPFPEVFQSHLHLPRQGGPPKISTP